MSVKPQEDLQKAHERLRKRESLLETLESIVVAFILAFVFRAFIVEAFVIPTGSMAPTLYGAHLEFKCSDCGYEFAVGHKPGPRAVCPNCFANQTVPENVSAYSGDRILVLKYRYDFEEPQRWDVIVFRNPTDPAQNYIKRLVGLPGEALELVRGDVTIDGRIAHKPDRAQDALWMIVHDTRNRATRREFERRWVADKPWTGRDGGFSLEQPLPRNKVAWLTYHHRGPIGQPDNIFDFYAYNPVLYASRTGPSICTDLGLRAEVTAGQPSSVVVFEMRAWKDRFRFELTAEGSEEPSRVTVNDKVVAQSAGGVLPVGRSVKVEVANVDCKLMLLVGDRRVANIVSAETTPEGDPMYQPRPLTVDEREAYEHPQNPEPKTLAAEVRVGVRGGPVSVAWLRLDRDVYYTNALLGNGSGGPGHGTEGNAFLIQADEFFVCGDNSPESFDSRLWPIARPVVPRRNLVGKAFFVYWPAAGPRLGIPLAPDPTGFRLVH